MARVLVVDDSPDQAEMISAILGSEGYEVEIARDGNEALTALESSSFEIVITDLIMPGMDGLELVEVMRKKHPAIPVILLTAYGSGEIATKALQKGAASYVPKLRLRTELIATVESTLDVARSCRDRQRVLGSLIESEHRFRVGVDQSLIAPLIAHIRGLLDERWELADDTDLTKIGIAIQEALVNAVVHGNLEMDSALRERDPVAYDAQINLRRLSAKFRDRTVELRIKISPAGMACMIQDEGPGFDPASVRDPTNPANLESVTGRGLYLIHTFMDEVIHNLKGNQITMVKHFG